MQRVAIGRALVRRPKAMLMDEPIGALDAKLREEMRGELKRLHLENGTTTVYVTHDQVEAMALADRIAIMNEGLLQQAGTPTEVYQHPTNLFVAQFVGSPVMNVSRASLRAENGQHDGRLRRWRRRVRLPGRAAAATRRGRRRRARADGRHPARERARRPARDRGLHPGRGAYHRAARRLRHRRPQARPAVPARPHRERLCRQGRRHRLGEARRGADPFLQRSHRSKRCR